MVTPITSLLNPKGRGLARLADVTPGPPKAGERPGGRKEGGPGFGLGKGGAPQPTNSSPPPPAINPSGASTPAGGRSSRALMKVKIVVFAPTPSPRVSTTTAVKP